MKKIIVNKMEFLFVLVNIFFFLIFPILVILPLSFNAENFFTFTKAMLAFLND